ncbi:hypothetical protein KM043_001066 [Ampulex compressa]|nr:hypothetical protein KM043_001066 [Ampulex compressa]
MDRLGRKRRVCVIGAGAAGLCAARHLARCSNIEFRVYEQTAGVGGTWVYEENIGTDEDGLQIHTSMYRNLRTNLPVRIMNFPDYATMNQQQPSCASHVEILTYLRAYAEHFDLKKYIQFHRKVESVRLRESAIEGGDEWIVRSKNVKTRESQESVFDAVMVCNGHYFEPYVPIVPGIEDYPGIVLHSHAYRKPEDFAGKIVIILGAASSGIDIAIDLANYVPRLYLSHNHDKLPSLLPSNVIQVPGVDRIEGSRIRLKDQSTLTAEVFIFCTGYRYSFPFLEENCGIRVEDNHVAPLYKHLINIEHPTMCIIGIPTIVLPFPMFHMQVQFFLAILQGVSDLPSKSSMLEEARVKGGRKRDVHKMKDRQWAYNDSLADAGGFERLPAFYEAAYKVWSDQRLTNLLRYKDSSFYVSEDGKTIEIVVPD